jgi:hypothetical protein
MEHIDILSQSNSIYCPKRITIVVFYDFKDARSFAIPWLCVWMFAAKLSDSKGISHGIDHGIRKREEVSFRRSNPMDGTLYEDARRWRHIQLIPKQIYAGK